MAQDPYLSWYPRGSRTLKKVSLGFVSDLRPVDVVEAEEVVTGHMAPYRTDLSRARMVPIVKERFTSASLRRDLEAVVIHLRAGGAVGFSLDGDKPLARFGTPPNAGDTSVALSAGDPWGSWNSSAAFASGDEIRIEQPGRELRAETVTYTSGNTSAVTTSAYLNGYDVGPVLVRYRDFYPVLRLPAGLANSPDLLTHDRRLNYTLSLPLVEYPQDLFAFYDAGFTLGAADSTPDALGRYSLDEWLSASSGMPANTFRKSRVGDDDLGAASRFGSETFGQPVTGTLATGRPRWMP